MLMGRLQWLIFHIYKQISNTGLTTTQNHSDLKRHTNETTRNYLKNTGQKT